MTMEDKIKRAYWLGFMDSGEGWNGEYPFRDSGKLTGDNPVNNKDWIKSRDKRLRELSPKKRGKK